MPPVEIKKELPRPPDHPQSVPATHAVTPDAVPPKSIVIVGTCWAVGEGLTNAIIREGG